MKKLFSIVSLVCFSLYSFAQSSLSELGCGTITTSEELQDVYDFVKRPVSARKTTATDTIPITIHIIGDDNGKGYYKLDNLFPVICQLNNHFATAGLYFSIKFPIRFINNSSYYVHDYNDGYNMMVSNNVAGTANVYFVEDPNGACGYYAPAGGALAIGKNCANTNSTTLVHELGHFLGLPHTFYGWEGHNTSSPPSNPELVTRGPGANCSSAGDGFCDTEADYISQRWRCPYSGTYSDLNGDAYKPDATNYMSYSNDACMTNFSAMQIGRMKDKLATTYRSFQNTIIPAYTVFSKPKLLYPTDTIYSNYTKLIWNKVKGAEAYQVKFKQGSIAVKLETVTADTFLDISSLSLSQTTVYNISIVPLNGVNVCRSVSLDQAVAYSNATTTLSVSDLSESAKINVYPNPARESVTVDMRDFEDGKYLVSLSGITGQLLVLQTIYHPGGNFTTQISTRELSDGLYFIRISGEGQSAVRRFQVQH